MPALEPEPFDEHDMRERIANGWIARTELARELSRRERGAGVENAVVGPGVVIVKKMNVFDGDGSPQCI